MDRKEGPKKTHFNEMGSLYMEMNETMEEILRLQEKFINANLAFNEMFKEMQLKNLKTVAEQTKDLYKTQISELSKWRNTTVPDFCGIKKKGLIPESIILKEPSAELKLNQKDEDSLPKYSVLDKILELIIDKNYDLQSIKKYGFNEKLIKKIWNMLKNAEFKRYQSAIGPKISSMSFDKDRRFPITNKFRI